MTRNYLQTLLIKNRGSYSKIELEIANYFKKIGNEVTTKSLAELSEESGVSESSIFNFVKKLGFNGFQEFKIKVATMSNPVTDVIESDKMTAFDDITPDDSSFLIAQKIIKSNAQSITNLIHSIDENILEAALELIRTSGALHFFGSGASSIVAFDSFHKFHRSHLRCNYVIDSHMQLTYATKLDETDCAFLFSHTGNSIEINEIASILRENNVSIISMTGNHNSKLAEMSDVTFVVDSEEFSYRSEALTARFLYLTLIDILYVCIMYENEEENIESLSRIRTAIAHRRFK